MILNPKSLAQRPEAPNDQQEQCSEESSLSPMNTGNVKVLMDSWNYRNLLPPNEGTAWVQVNKDNMRDPVVKVCTLKWLTY